MTKLSAIILTQNEESNIKECLESVRWVDEILVVDSFSTDRTLDIVRETSATVIQNEYVNYSTQIRWAIPKAKNDWVLIVDADERMTPALSDEIRMILKSGPTLNGYRIRRMNYIWGKPIHYSGWQSDRVLRFFNRKKGAYETKHVHPRAIVEGRIDNLKGLLVHYTYRDMKQYFEKFQRYTDWGAQELDKQGEKATLNRLIFHPIFGFFRMYILRLGFMDGVVGFILCMLSSFNIFAKYAKLWDLNRRKSL